MTELSLLAKVTLVLVTSLAVTRVAARASASMRALILTSAFCVLLALPVVSIALSSMAVAVTVPVMAVPMATIPAPAPTSQITALIPFWLRAIWLIGSVSLFLRIITAMWRMRSMRATAIHWTSGDALVAGLARDAGVSRSIVTLLREDARAPLTMGIVRPAIVLPTDAQTWTESDLSRALVHEIEHIRRNDWGVHMLARVVCAAYWFHPLAWVAWRRLRLDSERACDDGVLRRADGTAYAEQLLLLARRLNTRSAVGPFMASRTDLATRIAAVIDSSQRRDRPGRLSRIAAAPGVMLVLLAIAPVQAVRASATLTGNLFDPFGGAVDNVKLYLEQIGGTESYQGRTDQAGHFAFKALPAGTYRLAAPMDFVPATTIALSAGAAAQRDIRMEVETLTDTFTVCADCPPEIDTYVPPDSLVAEFQRDRMDASNQPVKGPEPVGGWESYWSRLPEYPRTLRDAGLEGIVIVEGRIGTDGLASDLKVVSDVHPALASAAVDAVQAERWEPGRVRGIAIEVPLRMTIAYILRARHQ
jgi:beta-lactamase regulating signal transducer with metallopeptidase domain